MSYAHLIINVLHFHVIKSVFFFVTSAEEMVDSFTLNSDSSGGGWVKLEAFPLVNEEHTRSDEGQEWKERVDEEKQPIRVSTHGPRKWYWYEQIFLMDGCAIDIDSRQQNTPLQTHRGLSWVIVFMVPGI